MRKYGDDARYSSLDVMCPVCGSWHSVYTECSYCRSKSHISLYDSSYYNNYDKPKNILKCPLCGFNYNTKLHSSCPHCKSKHESISHDLVRCPKCGRKKPRYKPCSYCNNVIVCPKCGKRYNKKHKGKWVTSCPHCNKSKTHKSSSDRSYKKSEKKYGNSLTSCPTCGRKIVKGSLCPHCSTVECPTCGRKYNKNFNSSCPNCASKKKSSNSNDGWIIGLCCIGIIMIFLIFAILGLT